MANVSTLTVSLVAETAKFENGLKKSKKSAGAFGKAAGKAMKGAAIATAALTVALSALVKQSLALVDQQRKSARTLGTTQGIYAGLALAAGIAGSSVEGFAKALKRQQKSIVDAADGLMTQKRAFDRLGLSAKDLMALPVEEQFKTITTALGKVENSTIKVGIASDLFGAKNADLINIIELGADGIDHYIQKVKQLGVALTDNQTGAIEESNDAVLIMKTAFQGLGNQLAARLAPSIKASAERITSMTERVTTAIPKWFAWSASILGVRRALNSFALADFDAEIKQVNADIDRLQGKKFTYEQNSTEGNFEDPFLREVLEQLEEAQARYNELIRSRAELKKRGEVLIPEGGGGLEGGDGTSKYKSPSKYGTTDYETLKRWRLVSEELEKNFALFDQWEAAATAAFNATRTPLEQLQITLAALRANPFVDAGLQDRAIVEAVDKYKAGLKSMQDAQEKAAKEMTEFQRQAFSNMQDILADFLFDPFEDGLKGMLKSFVDMLRKMVAQLIAQKILEYFFGLFGATPTAPSSGGTTGPTRAIGGPVQAGQSYRTHDNEIFTPGASGSIRPLGAITFAPSTTIGGDGGGLDIATLVPILEENNRKLKAELIDGFDRGTFQ